jgi:NAD(P)-dependent dehydrogenase (short-subunit alcohol dehydrogenase family)
MWLRFVFWKYLTLDPPTNAAVLITGTSTGIGRGFALRLARSGVTVIATVRRQEDVDNWKKQHPELVKVVKPIILGAEKYILNIPIIIISCRRSK